MKSILFAGALALGLSTMPAFAAETLSGAEISTMISGNTVEGSMIESGRYSEFYDADGTIRGEGYTGAWAVEADTMCFTYDGADPDCWSVGRTDTEVLWIKDGETLGTGELRPGNPNNY